MGINLQVIAFFIIFLIIELCSCMWAPVLQYNRTAIIDHGQLWRLFTGHFTHWNYEHLAWDTFAFLIASFLLIRLSLFQFIFVLLFSLLFISLWIFIFNPSVEFYRGLSGVDVAMFFSLSLSIILFSLKKRRYTGMISGILFLLFMIIKLGYEFFLFYMLFVRNIAGRKLLLSAHFAGALAGVICFLIFYLLNLEKDKRTMLLNRSELS